MKTNTVKIQLTYYHNYDNIMINKGGASMIAIRPVSDLRNKFTDIEKVVNEGEPVFLTKNGYGSMVVMSIDAYSRMIQDVEQVLDETDEYAESNTERMTHEDVFGRIRRRING